MWRWVALGIAALGGLLSAGPAAAANLADFADPAGDARRAPDITAVSVSNEDTGVLTFALSTPGERIPPQGTVVRILLDTDRNATTGSAGAEWAIVVADGRSVAVHEWWIAGWIRRIQRTPPVLSWLNGPTVTIDRSEVGWPSAFAFRIEATRTVGAVTHHEHAPDETAWSYDVVVPDVDGDRFPDPVDNCPFSQNRQFDTDRDGLGNECDDTPYPFDFQAPVVEALPSAITRGRIAYLRYRLWEDGRATSERVTVLVGGRTRAVLDTRYAQIDDGVTYSLLWRVPRGVSRATFCVRATDEAANTTPSQCAPLSTSPAPATPVVSAPTGTLVIGGRPTFVLGVSNGPPPLGATTPEGGDALAEVVRGGVNMLRVGPSGQVWTEADLTEAARWNEAAAAVGASTWVSLQDLALAAPGTPEAEMLRRVVQRLRADPGLGMWRGVDEPYWARWTPAALEYAFHNLRALDPAHPLLTVQAPRGTRWDLAPFAAATSAHGVNAYPVSYASPEPPLHQVGRWAWTVRAATPNNAVVTTLQVCSSASIDRSIAGAFVLPTLRQERYMAYDAIINGARGLMFFGSRNPRCLTPRDAPHGWNWTFWRTVLKPLLAELRSGTPLHRALLAPRARLRLRISDPTTQVDVRAAGRRELWVLAARHGRGSSRVRISGLPAWAKRATVYGERRSLATRDGSFADRFTRWDVHVYRFSG